MKIQDRTFLKACNKDNFDLLQCTQVRLARWLRRNHSIRIDLDLEAEEIEKELNRALDMIPDKCKDKIAFESICELQETLRFALKEINCPHKLHVPYFTMMFNRKIRTLQRKRKRLADRIGKKELLRKITEHNKKRRALKKLGF